jgi:hypothetical protein
MRCPPSNSRRHRTAPGVGLLLALCCVIAGCVGSSGAQRISLRLSDPPIWLSGDDIERYVCTQGLLLCESEGNRLSKRRCRCLE